MLRRLTALTLTMALVFSATLTQAGTASAGAPKKIAVFNFDLIDDSQEGEMNGVRADETQRLVLISVELRRLLKADGRYEAVDLSAISADIERLKPMYKCNHCEDELARKVGADYVMIGTVQKVSNLILNLNLFVRDVKTEKIIQGMSSDIRSNSDDSWMHGVRYVVKNQLLADKQPGQQ
ncbi:MAG: DUF3280 domain-containing protein [Hyphomicrobiaceae bacterium]